MTTTITKTVGSTGRDYATPALWNTAHGGDSTGDLVANDTQVVAQFFNDSEFTGTSVTLSTFTTDSALEGFTQITSGSWAGGVLTLGTLAPHGLSPGQYCVSLRNVNTNYNGFFVCASGTTGSTINVAFSGNPGAFSGTGRLATHIIVWTTGTGQSFADNAGVRSNPLIYNATTGVGISNSAATNCITNATGWLVLNKLQIKQTGGGGASPIVIDTTTPSLVVNQCIIESTQINSPVISNLTGGLPWVALINSHFLANGGVVGTFMLTSGAWALESIYCTFVQPSDIGGNAGPINQGGSEESYTVCAFFGGTSLATGPTYTNCMSDLPSPPTGVMGGKTYLSQFQNTTAASGDYRVKSGADLIGAAVEVPGIATDISGFARP